MKFEYYKGLIWIAVSLEYEGKLIGIDKCIFDTGSATTAIDIDLVDFDYRKPSFIRRLCGFGRRHSGGYLSESRQVSD